MFKLSLVILLTLPPLKVSAQIPTPQELAVVDGIHFTMDGIPKTVHERDLFYAALNKKLASMGWSVVQPIQQDSCDSSRDCLAPFAEQLPARYVVRITGEGNLKVGYTLHYQLYSVATKHSQKTNTFCEICFTDDIAATSAELILGLLDDAHKDDAEVASQQKTQNALSTAAKTQPPAKNIVSLPPIPEPPRRAAWVPWSIIGVGAMGLAYGSWALYEDGKTVKNLPVSASGVSAQEQHSSKSLGIVSFVGGGVLAVAGTVWLAVTPSRSAAVAISPSHVIVSLRY